MTTKQIPGEFTVTLAPIEGYAHGQQGVNLGRMSIDKQFTGTCPQCGHADRGLESVNTASGGLAWSPSSAHCSVHSRSRMIGRR